jgi:AcrR family transcriptional regulator
MPSLVKPRGTPPDRPRAKASAPVPAARSNRRGVLRREALLAVARDVFLEHGYANASIEEVVGRTGGSKASLYRYFGSKEGLFGAMVSEGCKEFLRDVAIPTAIDGSLRDTLKAFGLRFFRMYTDAHRVKLMRAVIAEATRFPGFAHQLYMEGPQQVRIGLAAFFARCHHEQLLHAPNADLAAIQFITLVKGHCQFRSLFGLSPLALPLSADAFIDDAVRLFLDGCMPKKPSPRSRS